ncbi:MAG: orotidine-5'-phosphate decarboxylase [SAR324 cluster bacterium]|nr:orotidine-5'-phosphate decarboxylase [SAR324 cluster bacterium]MBL7035023.1 orotidine-5'-phosphate decarboxylase [SAR324 cluster bacterium]
MTFIEKLEKQISVSQSYLCVGLDPDWAKIPEHLPRTQEGLLVFLQEIVKKTQDSAAAFKPNFAFFEALGPTGMEVLQEIIRSIPQQIPVIGDAKRGDVGHTAQLYARAAFETFGCDAVTVTPYQGEDSLRPFFDYHDRGIFVLCLTSNAGAVDFQLPELHLEVARKVNEWNVSANAGLVVGATRPENIAAIRKVSGQMPYLIPGVGAQGGELKGTLISAEDGTKIPYLINASRSILYASTSEDYALKAGEAAKNLKDQINLCHSNL